MKKKYKCEKCWRKFATKNWLTRHKCNPKLKLLAPGFKEEWEAEYEVCNPFDVRSK